MCTQFACFIHFLTTKDLAPFSIHIPTKNPLFQPINDQFIVAGSWHMLSTAKSANVRFWLVVQLFVPPTYAAMHLAQKIQLITATSVSLVLGFRLGLV